MTSDELVAIAESVLARAKSGEQIEVITAHSTDTEVRAYEGEVESFSSADTYGVGIRVVRDGRQGFASAGTLDREVLAEVLADARDNLRFASVDPFVALAEPDGVAPVELKLFDQRLVDFATESKIDLVLELERRVLAADPRIVGVESVEFADSVDTTVVLSTTGIRAVSRTSGCSAAVYNLAGDGDDVATGFGFSLGRHPGELDLDVVVADATRRATQMLGAQRAPSQRLTVVFDPWVSAQFLGIVADAFSGTEVFRGRSFLADRVGETVASPKFTLAEDPTDQRWMGASAVDDEGMASRRVELFDGGVVRGFVHDAYSARALGATSTGSAVRSGFRSTPSAGARSVVPTPGHLDDAALIASVGNGLWVSDVQGLHSGVNPVSGDFSTGIEGRLIRGGELGEPVREVTIASTLQRMLAEIVEVGDTLVALPMNAAGVTLVIGDVTLSGS